ncbi:MAG TPA: PBSX family phage terminase large subunit, partial [Bacillota bacterium]|nr:PBSX family phage terminase large subunit [Bacillota bacterium]
MVLIVPFSIKQQEYLQKATQRWNFKTGAASSGKTWLDYVYVIPRRIEKCEGNGLIVIIGNTKNTI